MNKIEVKHDCKSAQNTDNQILPLTNATFFIPLIYSKNRQVGLLFANFR